DPTPEIENFLELAAARRAGARQKKTGIAAATHMKLPKPGAAQEGNSAAATAYATARAPTRPIQRSAVIPAYVSKTAIAIASPTRMSSTRDPSGSASVRWTTNPTTGRL